MSSPIHSFLFSPPQSPTYQSSSESKRTTEAHGLTSLKSLILPKDFGSNRTSLDDPTILRAQSPRTPQQRHFKFERMAGSPSLYSRPTITVDDVDATPRTPRVISLDDPMTPKASSDKSATYAPNVPSTSANVPVSLSLSLPKPLMRLLCLCTLVVSCLALLTFVPGARLPSLSLASTSRRLALASDGRAYYDVSNGVGSWAEAKERDYVPPQIRVPHMHKRSTHHHAAAAERVSVAPPKATRPHSVSRPLPNSHELLAVQSYLLQSEYNLLPLDRDSSRPLDAETVMSFSAHRLGAEGSPEEKAWLEELEQERHDDIVVWYGGNG